MYRAYRWNAASSKIYRESSKITLRTLLQKEVDTKRYVIRNNTVSAGRGAFNLVRFAISGVLATGASIGAAIFYAGRDEKVRDELEKVPFAQQVLLSIYGEKKGSKTYNEDPVLSLTNADLGKTKDEESLLRPLTTTPVENEDVKEEDVITEENETLASEDDSENKVVVITTIDDQAAVSSVDLDISNASSQPKKKVKKKKKDKKEKKPPQKEEAEASTVKETSEEALVQASSIAEAVELTQENQSSVADVSAEIPEGSTVLPPTEATKVNEIVTSKEQTSVDNVKADDYIIDTSTMEASLKKHMEELKLAQDFAIQKHADASEKITEYCDQLSKVMSVERESLSFDDEWKATSALERVSQGLVDEAKDSELKMQAKIESMYKLIQGLRESGSNEIADMAQETATKASLELMSATDKVKKAGENLLELSRNVLVKEEDVQKEVSPLMESLVSIGQNNGTLESLESSNSVLLTYAMKRIEFLKKDLENLRIAEEEKLQEMIQKVREEEEKNTEMKLTTQEENLKRDFDILLQKKEADLLEEFENEMRKQLKRQSAAHREHLADVLDAHTNKLSEEYKADLEGKLRRERLMHGNELSKVASHLRGVESVVDSISDVEKKSRKTRELWLAVQSLSAVLNEEVFSGRTKNLWPEISSIAKLAENNETVQFLLETIPESAAVQGIATEEGLRKRFEVVKRICKRVAMVDDNGSLWTYFLSAIRSLLVFETQAKRDIVNEIDPEGINPYEILAKAQHCIEEGDLELAVKFMSLLKGLPRRLAGDWLREARVYLETKQASEFLLAYLASEATCDQSS